MAQDYKDAKHQAEFEYGELLGKWDEVPGEVDDFVSFVQEKFTKDTAYSLK